MILGGTYRCLFVYPIYRKIKSNQHEEDVGKKNISRASDIQTEKCFLFYYPFRFFLYGNQFQFESFVMHSHP